MKYRYTTILRLCAATVLAVLVSSCHKTCVCLGYDGSEHRYSSDEVDDRGVTCANMIFQSGRQFYSVCNWE